MKTTAIFAALLTGANADLWSPSSVTKESSYKALIDESLGDVTRDHKGKPCSEWAEMPIQEVPVSCIEELFCNKEKKSDNIEQCPFNDKVLFTEKEYSTFSDECLEQAVCNAIKSRDEPKPEVKEELPRDIEVPDWARDNLDVDFLGNPCSNHYDKKHWSEIYDGCVYNYLCNYYTPLSEPECTSLDENKKSYSDEEFKKLPVECARVVLCQRAKGEINTERLTRDPF